MQKNIHRQKIVIPSYVQKTARMLIKEGFQAYLVGGALRDVVLGIEPDDYDLATDALPEQMLQIFPKSVSTGVKFGMVTVLTRDNDNEHQEVQVTTFRSEQKYVEGRWPSEVKFITDIDEDLSRRDFTWNAMALNLDSPGLDDVENEKEWEIYDPFNGLVDIGLKVTRAVGDPIERFSEDGLRMFRACRLSSQLQFSIEDETFAAIEECLPVAKMISAERVRDEFIKTLMHSPKPSVGLELMRKSGLMKIFLPELLEAYGVEQKLYHGEDVYHHLLRTCDMAHDRVKIAALFHDIGKPRKDMGNGHFYGHDMESASMTRDILKRLKFPKSEIERNVALVKNHMFFYPHKEEDSFSEKSDGGEADKEHKFWSDSAVRRFLARVGEENIEDLFLLRIADATANPKTAFDPEEIEALQRRISDVRKKDMALKVGDLDIDGNDLMEMGVEKGPQIGYILNKLLEIVIEEPRLNDKEKLKMKVKELAATEDDQGAHTEAVR